jgi:ribonuclease P protein component
MLATPPHPLSTPPSEAVIGLTVTKKLGNAVVRNKIKRRIRAALHTTISKAQPGQYVIIPKKDLHSCPFPQLIKDLEFCFKHIARIL